MLYVGDVINQKSCYAEKKGRNDWSFDFSGVVNDRTEWRASSKNSALPRLLVFHDSFGPYLEHLLSNHVSEVLFTSEPFDPRIVETFKPDAVIDVQVERALRLLWLEPEADAHYMRKAADKAERAKSGAPPLLRIAPPFDSKAVEPAGATFVEAGATSLAFRSTTGQDGLALPEFEVPSGTASVLLELDVEGTGGIDVYYRRSEEREWTRRQSVAFDLASKRATFEQSLELGPGRFRLFLRPRQLGSTWTLRNLEIHAEGRR
jgi:hypothetical protein